MAAQHQNVGTLKDRPLIKILSWVQETKFSGVLVLAKENIKKSIIFDQGKPIAARSNIENESLGALLVSNGHATQDQIQQSLSMLKGKEALRQGEALLSMGIIDNARLHEMLRFQLIQRIREVFLWDGGKYAFVKEVPADFAPIQVDEPLMAIAFRGLIGKHLSSEEAKKIDLEITPMIVGGGGFDISELRLVGKEMGFFRMINGVHKVKDILSKSRLDEETSRSVLLALRELGMLALGDERARPSQASSSGEAKEKARPAVDNEILKEIFQRLDDSRTQDHFAVLGLARTADDKTIKEAYFKLAKRFHPDKLQTSLDPEQRSVAEGYFARITESHRLLTNKADREEYLASLAFKEGGMGEDAADKVLQSEVEYQKGLALQRKGRHDEAARLFKDAIEFYDQEAEYYLQFGWSLFRSASKTGNEGAIRLGKENINKALKMDENLSQAFYYKGMISKSEGDLSRAKRNFEKCIEGNRNHNEATSELRFINMKAEKDAKGGTLGKFFKKK